MPSTPKSCYFCHRPETETELEVNGDNVLTGKTWRCADKATCVSWREQHQVRLQAATAEFATSDLRSIVDRRDKDEREARHRARVRDNEVRRANLDHEYAARLGISVAELRRLADIYEDYLQEREDIC